MFVKLNDFMIDYNERLNTQNVKHLIFFITIILPISRSELYNVLYKIYVHHTSNKFII